MNEKKNKMIAPVVITVIGVIYYAAYFGLLIYQLNGIWKYALGIIPLFLAATMVGVCIERIREIKEEDKDDLSKY